MSVVLCIDFGLVRCGVAISDPQRIIASPLATVASQEIEKWLAIEIPKRHITTIVIGFPTRLDGTDSHITENVRLFKAAIQLVYPEIEIVFFDERFSSKMASQSIAQMGHKKKKQDKGLIDQVAAALILQEYLSLS
jgi:putative Holliday junction resolvase